MYDLLALRIITDSVKNCYAALGVIHNEWHPIPGRIKDFIAIPRPNLYQSLHTSVMGPSGHCVRSADPHRGDAPHRRRRHRGALEVQGRKTRPRPPTISASPGCGSWSNGSATCATPASSCRPSRWTCTRKRSTRSRRAGKCNRAAARRHADRLRVRDSLRRRQYLRRREGQRPHRSAALRSSNGDVVEILTQPGHLPSKDWLAIVKTSRARNKIKHVINATERVKAIEIGAEVPGEGSAPPRRCAQPHCPRPSWKRSRCEYGYSKMEDLHAALGYGKFSARQVLHKLAPDQVTEREAAAANGDPAEPRSLDPSRAVRRRNGDLVIKVKGIDDLMVYRAKCCNPIRGESIVGYVTRGKGVAVHSANCTERAEPDVRSGAQDRSRVGAQPSENVPGPHGDPHRRPAGHAESAHVRALPREQQHSQPRSAIGRRAEAGTARSSK